MLRRARIERVFHQLLHHRGGPLDHLASGDLISDAVGEDADVGHGGSSPLARH
jgi:hypothetical protein